MIIDENIKTIIPLILIVLLLLLSISCKKNILDIPAQDRFAEDAVWSDAKLIQAYHNELYNSAVHGFSINGFYSKYTDEVL